MQPLRLERHDDEHQREQHRDRLGEEQPEASKHLNRLEVYMDRIELELYLNNTLETARFKDYCPNGLQVEGRRKIEK
ncbi:MAG TPA: Nif3-like dinuclear metal center hexameric protein, partial [Paraburkholderia sp.]|nr:Nif3-like dinuclear metal center hexameric protein [Paraburkholderia sp.]